MDKSVEDVLAGLNLVVEDGRLTYMRDPTPTHFSELREAQKGYRRAELALTGVACPPCAGSGDAVTGRLPADLFSPAEDIHQPCPTCSGEGLLLPAERVRWLGCHPEYVDPNEKF